MKPTLHVAIEQSGPERRSKPGINGTSERRQPETCPVSELRMPECSCPRCHERMMKPRAQALTAVGADKLRVLDAAAAPGFLNGPGTLTEQDVCELALLDVSEPSPPNGDTAW